ncbi:MAG: 16S rRNA (uracil(1498)-N(3))-methyltransferase [Gammaproteobacteria bacterium]|nr:16S rRNA (uracil(1498)-N(3))-methyltransferase [Gammaproteobacteria bacterium]
MRTIRIYQNQTLITGQTIQLDPEASNHIANVLRMRIGEYIVLFDGKGSEYTASINSLLKKSVTVTIESEAWVNRESPLHIHLAQALAKGDKMEWVIQKAVELGVAEISSVFTERSNLKMGAERWDKKLEHWQKVAISACEQCGRNTLPIIHAPITLIKFLDSNKSELSLILHTEISQNLASLPDTIQTLSLLIGPEGGFSETEIKLAQANNCITLNLGPRILRTETAPLAAIALFQAKWGDM